MSTPDTQMNQYLNTIAEAVHGRDMRAAIHDGLEKTYNDAYTWFDQSLGNANEALQKATEALDIAGPMGDDIQEVKDLAEDLDSKYDETNERVNNIIAHNQDTDGNSELIDLRTTYDGQVKSSAGSAVRSQISNLNSRVDNLVREQSTGELEDCHVKPVYVSLYENQYPSSAFAGQTLQLSLSGSPAPSLAKYAFIKITFKDSNLFGAGVRSVYIPNPGKDAEETNVYTSEGHVTMPADGTYGISSYSRKFTAALSSNDTVLNIMFTDCEKIATDNPFAISNSDMTISDPSSTTSADNEHLIPYEIFLIDYVLDGEIEVDKDTELIDIRNGEDGTNYQSAGAAVRGQIGQLKSALTPIVTGWNYGYKTNTGATGGTSGTDRQYSDPILCPEGSTVYYVGETNHGTIAGISFYDINMNFISGISNSGTMGTEQTATAPSNSWYCIISTKTTILNQSYAHVRNSMVETIKNITDDFAKKVFYVAPNGNDSSGIGTSDAPYKTINKAVQMGADVVFLTAGVYEQPATTNIQNKNGFAMYVIPSAPSTSTDHKPRAIYENAYTLAVSADAGSGLLAGTHTFAETSNWYKVFVSQTLPISPSGTQSVTYNAILWESDESDPSKDLKLVPKLTLAECQAATGSFYYDHSAGKVYINPSGTINNAKYKYLRFESDGALFTINNCQNVHIEDFEIKHSAGNGVVVTNSSNVTFKNCAFTHSAYRDGLMINRSNVDCVNCEALKETADGFGIANQGQGNFYNCHAHHNYDDGISHHDGSIGFVDGGYFHHNGKGGVASPYSGSNVNVKNAICEANAYGIYAGSGSDVCMICNCVLKDNTTSGILNVGYNPLYVFNCIFSGNTVNTSGQGTTTILTND